MKYIYVALLLFFSSFQCQSQAKSVEEIYDECYFAAMPDNGKQFKKIAKEYEIALIKHGLLKDNSSESYYNLFKKIFAPGFIDNKTDFHFLDSVNTITYIDLIRSNIDCTDKIKSLSHYKNSRSYKLEKQLDSITKNLEINSEKETVFILNFYTKEDFQLDYYKLRVLLLIPDSMPLFDEEKVYSKEQLEASFKIELIKGDKLLIRSSEVSLKEMKVHVNNHLKTKKAKSLIHISSERDVSYSYYLKVIDNLNASLEELKNEIALSKFNIKFNKLTASQKESIEKEYSFELIDKLAD